MEIESLKLSNFFFISFNKYKKSNFDKIQKIYYHIFKCPDEGLMF